MPHGLSIAFPVFAGNSLLRRAQILQRVELQEKAQTCMVPVRDVFRPFSPVKSHFPGFCQIFAGYSCGIFPLTSVLLFPFWGKMD
jgi:hypothetical protein